MTRLTKGSLLQRVEDQFILAIVSRSKNLTIACQSLGVTYRTVTLRLHRIGRPNGMVDLPPHATETMTLEEFKASFIRETVKDADSIAHACRLLGIATHTLDSWMLKHSIKSPKKDVVVKRVEANDLPQSMKRADRFSPHHRKEESFDVSVWVSPEERDEYYNYDFPWGTYHNHHGRTKKFYDKEPIQPCHALGYGEDP